jgi:uncharacterized damage-inducible protein DinB
MKPNELARLFTLNHHALHRNLDGVTDEEALLQPVSGNCLNWVVGHIVASRNGVLKVLGAEPYWPAEPAGRYARGSAPVSENDGSAVPFRELVRAFDGSQERIASALAGVTDADLARPHAQDQTVGEWLSFLHFHEAYHIGQTGLLRRLVGKEGAIK